MTSTVIALALVTMMIMITMISRATIMTAFNTVCDGLIRLFAFCSVGFRV